MTLVDLCEPLFLYICRLSRMARSLKTAEYAVVRSDVKTLIAEIVQQGSTDARLAGPVRKMELPLIFFADSMIIESNLNFSSQWQRDPLAYERNELAGDEKFFDLLDETLNDRSEEATEQLAVYYVCLGLGFTGVYAGQPEQLRKYMNQIFPRIRHLLETDPTARLCKEAYEHVDQRDLVEPPSAKMVFIGIIFLFFTLSVFAAYYWMFRDASEDLRISLRHIAQQDTRPTR